MTASINQGRASPGKALLSTWPPPSIFPITSLSSPNVNASGIRAAPRVARIRHSLAVGQSDAVLKEISAADTERIESLSLEELKKFALGRCLKVKYLEAEVDKLQRQVESQGKQNDQERAKARSRIFQDSKVRDDLKSKELELAAQKNIVKDIEAQLLELSSQNETQQHQIDRLNEATEQLRQQNEIVLANIEEMQDAMAQQTLIIEELRHNSDCQADEICRLKLRQERLESLLRQSQQKAATRDSCQAITRSQQTALSADDLVKMESRLAIVPAQSIAPLKSLCQSIKLSPRNTSEPSPNPPSPLCKSINLPGPQLNLCRLKLLESELTLAETSTVDTLASESVGGDLESMDDLLKSPHSCSTNDVKMDDDQNIVVEDYDPTTTTTVDPNHVTSVVLYHTQQQSTTTTQRRKGQSKPISKKKKGLVGLRAKLPSARPIPIDEKYPICAINHQRSALRNLTQTLHSMRPRRFKCAPE